MIEVIAVVLLSYSIADTRTMQNREDAKMTKNNKTHSEMIREAVEELGSAKPNSIMDFIRRKYPDIEVKETSFRADITGCSVNHSSSHHFPGMPKFLFFDTKNKTYRLDISECAKLPE